MKVVEEVVELAENGGQGMGILDRNEDDQDLRPEHVVNKSLW